MKGFILTLEAGIAAVIMFSFLFVVIQLQAGEPELSRISYSCLKDLDNKGYLRFYALNDENSLNQYLEDCLPTLSDFQIKVCNTSICPADNLPSKDIFLTGYIIAGDTEFNQTLINLWVWSK